MHKQHSTPAKGLTLVKDCTGLPILHVVLDQLRTRSYAECLRHYGDSEHYDTPDTLVDDDLLKRRGYR